MRWLARWSVVVVTSAATFSVSWWLCQGLIGVNEGAALGVAGAVLAVVLAVTGWWAAQERPGADSRGAVRQVVQEARAGRDVNMAGGDQVIVNDRRGDE